MKSMLNSNTSPAFKSQQFPRSRPLLRNDRGGSRVLPNQASCHFGLFATGFSFGHVEGKLMDKKTPKNDEGLGKISNVPNELSQNI